jgi:hypothetical protein
LTVITAQGTFATPVRVTAKGAAPLATLTGSEAEEAALETTIAAQQAEIEAIEKGAAV